MERIASYGYMRELVRKVSARKQWETENPELARVWTEALVEDALRSEEAEAQRLAREFAADAPKRLLGFGCDERSVDVVQRPGDTSAIRAVESFLGSEDWCLVLAGGKGTGKTVAGTYALKGVRQGAFIRASDLRDMSPVEPRAVAELEHLYRVPALVIDDLGAERMTEFWADRAEKLIDRRYAKRRRTVITTNLNPAQLEKQYGPRMVDRLRQGGRFEVLSGESMRRRG